MTRSEAIDTAVRRCLRLHEPALGGDVEWLSFWLFHPPLQSIRAHFHIICRQYGVREEPPAVFYKGCRIRVPDRVRGGKCAHGNDGTC